MKAYVGEGVLILTIAFCAQWTNTVARNNTMPSASQSVVCSHPERSLLSSVMQGITTMTEKPLIMFLTEDKQTSLLVRLTTSYSNECKNVEVYDTGTRIDCKLGDNNTLTLQTVTDSPQHMYVSVHQGKLPEGRTTDEIKSFCEQICQTSTMFRTTKSPLACKEYFYNCSTEANNDWCRACETTNNKGTPCDMTGQDKQQSTDVEQSGSDILPIIIASIVSFIAGVGVCLLVLCLIGHFHGRLCLKFTDSGKYVEKTAKSENQAPKSQIYTTSTIDMTEHEYNDLRCETMPHPNKKLEDVSSRGQKQPSAPNTATPTPMYETMASAQKDHVYSGLGKTEPNLETEYEHTSPNRSSEHMYSGMVHDKQSSDPTILQQVNTPDGIANTNGNQMHDTGDNEVGPNNYFVLEKEQHSTNQSKPGQGQGPDFGDIETAEDTDDYHSYHTLQKI